MKSVTVPPVARVAGTSQSHVEVMFKSRPWLAVVPLQVMDVAAAIDLHMQCHA